MLKLAFKFLAHDCSFLSFLVSFFLYLFLSAFFSWWFTYNFCVKLQVPQLVCQELLRFYKKTAAIYKDST